jgi:hypothetical protein
MAILERQRLALADGTMPQVMWLLLMVETAISVMLLVLCSSSDTHGHALFVAMYTTMLCLTMYLVSVLQFPFAGAVHVSAGPFLEAREVIAARSTAAP